MSEKLNARSTTYRVADDVVYDPREGDVFGMGDDWEYVVLGRVVVDGFDCVKFRCVVGETRTERTINLNEWIDRCVGKEIERQMPHHFRNRRVLHVAQFPCKASESGDHRTADEASGKLDDLGRCFAELRSKLAAAEAERDAAREALRKIAAVTNQLGPDRASSQYMAEQAHDIASAFLANAKPGGVGQ